jgi:poly(hydroxyalkanoate) depolymerase family esterase
MTNSFLSAMRRVAKTTRAFGLLGTTRLIQRTLATSVLNSLSGQKSETAPTVRNTKSGVHIKTPPRLRRPLGEVVATLRSASFSRQKLTGSLPETAFGASPLVKGPPLTSGAQYVSRSFTCKHGSREYTLYVPSSLTGKANGLVVMLHGCKQDPDDFAAGTNMSALAEEHGLVIVYPAQTRIHNVSSCWNWFEKGHQLRDAGEPAIIAALTRKLITEFRVNKNRVFVAGLSAGGAMAVIMGKTYPDLYRAVGVHSGLAYRSAGNVMSALAVMRASTGSHLFGQAPPKSTSAAPVRTIIFHGSADRTVHPSNAQRIADTVDFKPTVAAPTKTTGTSKGRRFTRTVMAAENGQPLLESWLVEGAGHAWFGGSASGSYADPKGPDASVEMVRFFLQSEQATG